MDHGPSGRDEREQNKEKINLEKISLLFCYSMAEGSKQFNYKINCFTKKIISEKAFVADIMCFYRR